MKKILLSAIALSISLCASAQTFSKGDMVVDLGIGVGSVDGVKLSGTSPIYTISETSGASFTQQLSFEYGVADFNDWVLGVGVLLSNGYGGGFDTMLAGSYDYSYQLQRYKATTNHNRPVWENYQTTSERRQGVGTADADLNVDDFSILFKASIHREFIPNLDTYATFGLGVSVYKALYSNYRNEVGFTKDSQSLDRNSSDKYQLVYSYNDLDHVKWTDDTDTKARFAMSLHVGARYYFNSHWAVNAQLGLISASFKSKANAYNVFSVGASYKF